MRRPAAVCCSASFLLTASLLTSCGLAPDTDPLSALECREDVVDPLSTLEDDGFSGAVVISTPAWACAAGFGTAEDGGAPVTPDTVFAIGSVTKVMTAAAVVELAERGLLDLDDPVGRHLPSLPAAVGGVTLRQLLTHTGGLGTTHGQDDDPLTRDAALDVIGGQELLFEPGARYAYSNSGYTLLGAVVEELTGSYRDFVVGEILTVPGDDVLGGFWDGDLLAEGPRATGYAEDGSVLGTGGADGRFWGLEGNGGVAMSPQALHDWVRALAAGDVVGEAGVDLMTTPVVDTGDASDTALGFGVLATAAGPALVAAGGGGTGHVVVVVSVPEADLVTVVATNRPDVTAEDLARPMVEALLAGEPVPVPVVGVDVDPQRLVAVQGSYEFRDGSTATVSAADDAVEVSATGGEALAALYPPAADAGGADGHERMVEAFLAGETDAGREELEALSEDVGEVRSVDVLGTAWVGGEFRTYVEVTAAEDTLTGYLALDGNGQPAAVDYGGGAPARRLVLTEDDTWVPATPGDVTLSVALGGDGTGQGTMVVTTPDGAVTATRPR
jgi:CubicO group peptidase (beta-lactamase class C family)